MTLVLARSKLAKNFVTGGQESIGVRVPSHPIAKALLAEFEKIGGHGVAAPSANRFKAVSPTTTDAVRQEIGNQLSVNDLILDGGLCSIGIESTIIDCTGNFPNIIRPGFITREQIQSTLLIDVTEKIDYVSVKTSGLFDLHYSPKAKVILNKCAKPGQGFLAMEDIPTPNGAIRLNSPTTIEEYARVLYESLRLADQKKLAEITVIMPPGNGVAAAIRDRLFKASGKRNLNEIS
jgi:L-threonylcarbamoyladenylate synthase